MADAKTTKAAESTGSATAIKTDEAPAAPVAYEVPKQKVKTLDSQDYDLGWTAQSPNRPVEPDELNPVTLSKAELPDEDAVAEQGVDVETYMTNFTNVEKD